MERGVVSRPIYRVAKDVTGVKKPVTKGWLGSLGPVASTVTALGLPLLFDGRPLGGGGGECVIAWLLKVAMEDVWGRIMASGATGGEVYSGKNVGRSLCICRASCHWCRATGQCLVSLAE